jgi:imidazolonepropionase-like amidohydrolase
MTTYYFSTLYTGEGKLEDVTIEVEGNRIIKIGKGKADYECEVGIPALVDPHSHIGLDRAKEPFENSDVNEEMESIVALGNVLDAIQMDDPAFKQSVEAGVLYSCVLPGSGNIIGGKAAVIRNFAKNTDEAFVKEGGIKMALGYNPKSTTNWKGTRPSTRIGVFALLRKAFLSALKKEPKDREPEEEVILNLIKGREKARIHVHKTDDVLALIRFADRFGLKYTVEHAAGVNQLRPFEELKKRKVPVVYGPLDSFPYKVELKGEDWRNIRYLLASGVKFGLMTDHPVILQQNLLISARWFFRFGYSRERIIGILSKRNAEILGLKNLGVIKEGAIASFSCWSSDPFSLDSYVEYVVAEGRHIRVG